MCENWYWGIMGGYYKYKFKFKKGNRFPTDISIQSHFYKNNPNLIQKGVNPSASLLCHAQSS